MSCGSCASCRSSASCGSCVSRPRGADIIDLDRYMRSAVKPHRDRRVREQLVVDAGGVNRAPRPCQPPSTGSDISVPNNVPTARPAHQHAERYSHDSGVSDGSYMRHRQKTHSRRTTDTGPRKVGSAAAGEGAAVHSASVVQFRLACEKALRDQQDQITRVAQLCERLAQPATAPPAASSDSSDASSSSRSSQHRRRDKRKQSESCRTYKIIMTKLDELSQLFAARRPPSPFLRPPQSLRRAASSGSVSVCDKVVATEPLSPIAQTVVVGHVSAPRTGMMVHRAPAGDCSTTRSASSRGRHAPASPTSPQYDLNDPIQLYQQAKRLETLHANAQRASSVERPPRVDHSQRCYRVEDARSCACGDEAPTDGYGREDREERLCAACRFYWRVMCRGLALLFTTRTNS